MTEQEIICDILSYAKEVDKRNYREPNPSGYELNKNEFFDIIDKMERANLITNVKKSQGGAGNSVLMVFLNTIKITPCGEEYLNKYGIKD